MARRALAGRALTLCVLAAGCASAAPPAKAPRTGGGAAKPKTAEVRVLALDEVPGKVPATWVFVSEGLAALGQPELVLTLQRERGESADGYPADAPIIVASLAKAVKAGQRFKPWQAAGIPSGMLGRADLTGIIVAPAPLDPRVTVIGPTLGLLLLTKDELAVALRFGGPRVANLLANRQGFFPFPYWVDRRHESVCSSKEMNASLIGQIERRQFLRGAGVWVETEREPGRVVLRLDRAAGRQLAKTLRELGDHVALFLVAPPEDVDARIVWTKLGDRQIVIADKRSRSARTAGNFLAIMTSDEEVGAAVVEDGFTLLIPKARWAEAVAAFEGGQPLELAESSRHLAFTLRWSTAAGPGASSEAAVPERVPYKPTP